MIETLSKGWAVMMLHSKLWLILLLVILFPAVYIFTFVQIQNVTYKNLESTELNSIQNLQNLVEKLVTEELDLKEYIPALSEDQNDITKVSIAKYVNNNLQVVYDLDNTLIGTKIENVSLYKSAEIKPGETFTYNFQVSDQSVQRAFRVITVDDTAYYIFTEHDFSILRSRIDSRIFDTYIYLLLIFSFLLSLAYWISRQINFEALHYKAKSDIAERDLFTNSLAHELRAPLTAMRGYASMVEESSQVPDTEKEYARKINQSSTRLVTLINDFLEAARIQSGKLDIKLEALDVREVIHNVSKNAELTATKKSLVFNVDVPTGPVILKTDVNRLEQILTNLVSNSIKYTEKGSISITLEKNFDKVLITIADTGGGISAEDQKKLFQPFVRVGTAQTQNSVTGTGLGMWITKKLVEQLGATIGLESIKDVGTHVVLSFPLK